FYAVGHDTSEPATGHYLNSIVTWNAATHTLGSLTMANAIPPMSPTDTVGQVSQVYYAGGAHYDPATKMILLFHFVNPWKVYGSCVRYVRARAPDQPGCLEVGLGRASLADPPHATRRRLYHEGRRTAGDPRAPRQRRVGPGYLDVRKGADRLLGLRADGPAQLLAILALRHADQGMSRRPDVSRVLRHARGRHRDQDERPRELPMELQRKARQRGRSLYHITDVVDVHGAAAPSERQEGRDRRLPDAIRCALPEQASRSESQLLAGRPRADPGQCRPWAEYHHARQRLLGHRRLHHRAAHHGRREYQRRQLRAVEHHGDRPHPAHGQQGP